MGFDIASIIGDSVGGLVDKIIKDFHADPNQTLAAHTELTKMQLDLQAKLIDQYNQQIEVNKIEAASPHVFVAGWRPAAGWVCVAGFAIQFVVAPIATWVAALCHHPIAFPQLDMSQIMPLMGGMLGLGGLRTYEKTQSIDTKNFS